MHATTRDNPETAEQSKQTAAEVASRLHEARRDRSIRPPDPPKRSGEDPMMNLKVRPRRKRCRHCRYRFNYRMHTNLCPECGRYRDDYPHPNHGLQAMLFAGALIGAFCVVVVLVLVLQNF